MKLLDAFTWKYGYQENVRECSWLWEGMDNETLDCEMVPNPESKRDFTDRMIKEYLISVHREYRKYLLVQEALNNASAEPDLPIN